MRKGSWVPRPVLIVLSGVTVLLLPGCQDPPLEFSTGIAIEDVAGQEDTVVPNPPGEGDRIDDTEVLKRLRQL